MLYTPPPPTKKKIPGSQTAEYGLIALYLKLHKWFVGKTRYAKIKLKEFNDEYILYIY